jgi:hypothetical protein
MVLCNAMAWTNETKERMKVLVTRSDPVAGTEVTTEEQLTPSMALAGTPAERLYMERKWWERLWQAMQRVQKGKSRSTVTARARSQAPVQEG